MYIVFEGIDGSGKTTLSTRLAVIMREQGLDVFHTREGGQYASAVAQAIREVGRDPQNLQMRPRTEMLLGMAREAQVMEESVMPALDRGQHVITDRSVFSWMALAVDGRKVDPAVAKASAEAATGGLWPDLVVVCDVDMRTSRRRKRLQKISDRRVGQVSRKGMSGLFVREANREGLLRMANADPDHWVVVDNATGGIEESLAIILDVVGSRMGLELPAPPVPERPSAPEVPAVPAAIIEKRDVDALMDHMYRMLEIGVAIDPAFTAFLLADFDDPRADKLREQLWGRYPQLIAWGLRGLSEASVELRRRMVAQEPDFVCRNLSGIDTDWAWELREQALESAEQGVIASLRNIVTDRSWDLRIQAGKKARTEVLTSVARLDDERAWDLRDKLGKKDRLGLGKSLVGLETEQAWELRDTKLKNYPIGLLASINGLSSDRANEIRRAFVKQAPRLVLGGLRQVDTPESFAIRKEADHLAKEMLDSLHSLDAEPAWEYRDRFAERWPHTAVRSLGASLSKVERGADFLWKVLARDPSDVHVIKIAALVVTRPLAEDDEEYKDVQLPR